MRIVVIGGGPAGLYFAGLCKRRHPGDEVVVVEQNAADATFGFGVVFSDRAMGFLRADDPETADLVAPWMETWSDVTLVHRGERIAIDGIGFSAIGRLELLRLLQKRAAEAGVELRYETPLASLDGLDGFDLVVGADGANSLVRRSQEAAFGTSVTTLDNRFAWFGTPKPFETLTQTFVESRHGFFNAHHYGYAPGMSTFIAECDGDTFRSCGLDRLDPEDSRALCEEVFAEALDGHPLVANRSLWRSFPFVRNERWFHGNRVLLGDALHTAHYSIGSGTRLALEDALALAAALDAHSGDIRAALPAYEAARRPAVEKLVAASRASAEWYEGFPAHMGLPPLDFAMSYITRSGRVAPDRLRRMAPAFMARYDAGNESAA